MSVAANGLQDNRRCLVGRHIVPAGAAVADAVAVDLHTRVS